MHTEEKLEFTLGVTVWILAIIGGYTLIGWVL